MLVFVKLRRDISGCMRFLRWVEELSGLVNERCSMD